MRKSLTLALVVVAAFAANAFAIGEARITGKILDAATKKPIENAFTPSGPVETIEKYLS